jgi:hypothetical protein
MCSTDDIRQAKDGARKQRHTEKCAALASTLSVRAKHEVVHDQLVFVTEQVPEGDRSVGSVELVVLVDVDHGELANLGGEGVLGAGKLLFLVEESLTGGEPLLSGYNLLLLVNERDVSWGEGACLAGHLVALVNGPVGVGYLV